MLASIYLNDRSALITGGAGYLGRTFGNVLAGLGASVMLLDREESVRDVASELPVVGRAKHRGIVADLTDSIVWTEVANVVAESCDTLDILINNAAFIGASDLKGWAVPFELQSLEAWNSANTLNLTVPFALTQCLIPLMKKSKHASVINIASIYGMVAPQFDLYEDTQMGNPAAYNTSKAGLIQLTRYLASALAPDIRVNAMSPGGIARKQPEAFVKRYESRVPLKRMATEDDFDGAIAFLASDMSRYVTGHNLVIDGGWTIV